VSALCVENTGVSLDAIKRFSDGPVAFDDDEKLKCYMHCMFHETGMLQDNGDFHFVKMLEKVPTDLLTIVMRMGRNCMKITGDNGCERAFSLHRCLKQQDPKVKK
jgi:hypothetical protein